jgi:proteasome lid subunit RPN8/RPN11
MARLRWKESKDVYKPSQKNLREFLEDKQQRLPDSSQRNIESLYREISSEPMTVFVERQAEAQLIKHLSIDSYNETGGVVVGEAYFCPETRKHYTEIVGSIAATNTVGNAVHFQFTPECWSSIFRNQKQYYSGSTIVGWYHSHPNHGIFLSGTDLNTQRLSFNKIWQIAVVFDPQRREIGYFYSAEGKKIEPIYLDNSSASESVRWHEDPRRINREEKQPLQREAQLPPVPASQQGPHSNRAILPQEDADRREENIEPETNKVPNRIVILIIIIVLVLIPFLLLIMDKMSENNPQNTPTPKYQPAPQLPDPPETQQLPDPPETQPTELQTTESEQLETQPSEFPESETTELESQSQQAEP